MSEHYLKHNGSRRSVASLEALACLLLQAVPFCCIRPALNSRLMLGKPEGDGLLAQPLGLPLRQSHLAPQRICFRSGPLQAHDFFCCEHALHMVPS